MENVRHWVGQSWWLAFAEACGFNVFMLYKASITQWKPVDSGSSEEVSRETQFLCSIISRGGHLVELAGRSKSCIAVLQTTSYNVWADNLKMRGNYEWGHFELL
jgi:hypothetical protein